MLSWNIAGKGGSEEGLTSCIEAVRANDSAVNVCWLTELDKHRTARLQPWQTAPLFFDNVQAKLVRHYPGEGSFACGFLFIGLSGKFTFSGCLINFLYVKLLILIIYVVSYQKHPILIHASFLIM